MLSWIEVDQSRFRTNVEAFRKMIGPRTSIMFVVKANAYGHGLPEVAPLAAEAGDWLGVNSIEEALEITRLGINNNIAILGHTGLAEAATVVANGYRQVLYRLDV